MAASVFVGEMAAVAAASCVVVFHVVLLCLLLFTIDSACLILASFTLLCLIIPYQYVERRSMGVQAIFLARRAFMVYGVIWCNASER